MLAIGSILALLLAWYHGEQGRQRVSGTELIVVALVLAFGGNLLCSFAGQIAAPPRRPGPSPRRTTHPVRPRTGATCHQHGHPTKSIAVLPFDNLGADKNNAYFTDGMQDMILTKLADIGGLRVMSVPPR